MSELRLPFGDPSTRSGSSRAQSRDDEPERQPIQDAAAREFAVDPGENVVLEASAGTGKTRVLVA